MFVLFQVIADGSIANLEEQESLVAPLLYCETVGAILMLRKDGCFILKTFTTMEHHTVCLMYLLNCCFSEVCVCVCVCIPLHFVTAISSINESLSQHVHRYMCSSLPPARLAIQNNMLFVSATRDIVSSLGGTWRN